MMKHAAVIVFALTALSGCSTVQDPYLTGSTVPTMTKTVGGTTEVAAHLALASLPGAGKVLAIRQTSGPDTIQQTIVLANAIAIAGENALSIDVGPANDKRYRHAPTREELRAEMRAALPGIAMAMTDTIQENAYGIYGYASGRADGGGTCIYAWQIVGGANKASAGSARGASIRLRLCQASGHPEQLAGLMRGLSLKSLDVGTISMLGYAAAVAAPVTAYTPAMVTQTAADEAETDPVEQEAVSPRPATKSTTTFASIAAPGTRTPDTTKTAAAPVAATQSTVSVPMPAD